MNNQQKKETKQKLNQIKETGKSRYAKEELSLIAATFLNEELIMAIRKHFMQGELTNVEQSEIDTLSGAKINIIRKCLLPTIDPNAPLHQMVDLWVSIDTREKGVDDCYLDMKARQIMIDYLDQRIERLTSRADDTDIQLSDLVFNRGKDKETAFIELKARNTLIIHIDRFMEELRILALANAEMSDEDKIKKLEEDSNK